MDDEKFILMNLNDEKTGDIAEILKNKTCKKILDFLADRKEASEKDIADGLGMNLNTTEYNLKKLVKSGLVKKTKNFFWSVKGRKIEMYKLARKHIIISPGKKPDFNALKTLLPFLLIAFVGIFLVGLYFLDKNSENSYSGEFKQFNSYFEFKEFLIKNQGNDNGGIMRDGGFALGVNEAVAGADVASEKSSASPESAQGSDYSGTNIQVIGVDEADIVKNDGKYIYAVSGNKVVILNAYPADEMEILSELEFDYVNEIFINEDKLIIFGNEYGNSENSDYKCIGYKCGSSNSAIFIYNVEDRENPELETKILDEGSYIDSRMIGDYVYSVSNKYADYNGGFPVYSVNGVEREIGLREIYYYDYPDYSYVFNIVSAINVKNGEVNSKAYLIGSSSNLFVSEKNIYLTQIKQTDYNQYAEEYADKVALEVLPSKYKDDVEEILNMGISGYDKLDRINRIIFEYSNTLVKDERAEFDEELMRLNEEFQGWVQKEMEKTIVHKISVDKMDISYEGNGEVPGNVLNQFSMDEYDGMFRIATTTGSYGGDSLNHVYILNSDLEIIGKLENLAEGERIYSARFLGERCYLVTFESIDPFFVIDLSNPEKPEVLGYLKIPGYSNYLHIYDENHVIGIGKDVNASIDADKVHSENAVYYTAVLGVKVSLFDVRDVENPVESAKFIIGDRGTESSALYEHKAILFDKEKNLLVLPIQLYEKNESKKSDAYDYTNFVWQGAYVLDISLDGINLRGKVSHDDAKPVNSWGNYQTQILRSLYIDDVLYTLSYSKIKANNLDDLSEIKSIKINEVSENDYPVLYAEDAVR